MVDSDLLSGYSDPVSSQTPSDAASPSLLPSSPDEDAGAAKPEAVVHGGLAPAPLTHYSSLLESTILQPLPQPSAPGTLPTLEQEARPDLTFTFGGSALPSTHVSLPSPPITKTARSLRLPSFDVLGIAAPHPNRINLHRSPPSFSSLGAGPLSKPEDPLHADSPPLSRPHQLGGVGDPSASDPEASKSIVKEIFTPPKEPFTPPTEPFTFNWGSFVNVRTTGVGSPRSPPTSDPGASPNLNLVGSTTTPVPIIETNAPAATGQDSSIDMATWADKINQILSSHFQTLSTGTVKVLSHALPCPSLTGHIFAQVIATIHESTPTPTTWINVFHAVPGRFTLNDLPKSPPSTPGPVVGGDEYFTAKVFDSAVAVPDYQMDSKLLPPSPRPVVAPGSVDISIVERYIPATNDNEFAEMFSIKGRSLLHDRLVELSANNGLLLLIYPTKTGAKTFMRDYLGPILDPMLRSITVVHELSAELGMSLGPMNAVDSLAEFTSFLAAVDKFCTALSSGPQESTKPKYTLVHASKEEVILDRKTWATEWWIKQEKPRVRELITKYFRKAKKLEPTEAGSTPTSLIQEVLDGVASREYEGAGPSRGVEVAVIVIKKSL
ncbi:hypothetical protein CC78DRAFT_530974 [Lojkania enalia]|uniref:Uncharacterized protein n=1 Tax=Lojkania enalia TaxID=147567 RepID=A0A9P4KEK1_9PLEO|nr:hypothetical protein CC78DRAFT_530974 [Didymosphaeria enalia]